MAHNPAILVYTPDMGGISKNKEEIMFDRSVFAFTSAAIFFFF
jgi:hypothetical protein